MADLLRGLGIVAIIGLALWNYWYFWATNRGDWLWRLMPVIVGLSSRGR